MALDYPDPELADDEVRLRRWELRDVDCVRLAAGDDRIPAGTSVPARYTPEAGAAFIHRQWARSEDGEGVSLAIERRNDGTAVGLIAALVRWQPGVVGLGYWIVPQARGSGLAGRSVRLVAAWLLGAGVGRVEALVDPENASSRRTLVQSGFRRRAFSATTSTAHATSSCTRWSPATWKAGEGARRYAPFYDVAQV